MEFQQYADDTQLPYICYWIAPDTTLQRTTNTGVIRQEFGYGPGCLVKQEGPYLNIAILVFPIYGKQGNGPFPVMP